uniref:succinate dehydrogenase subunit 4 n=1 Tax=Bostrychia tenuissima TaxID=196631 RepID=UPI002E78FF96|nr:succinate dehydrogenase subunit 4 [Bostrychia tenuissima]WQF69445.1 succinate dehydrogenase subunit 4 [Bostrychia tenuissima]
MFDVEFLITGYNLVFYHVLHGMTTIMNDYIHLKKLKITTLLFLRMLVLGTVGLTFEINF